MTDNNQWDVKEIESLSGRALDAALCELDGWDGIVGTVTGNRIGVDQDGYGPKPIPAYTTGDSPLPLEALIERLVGPNGSPLCSRMDSDGYVELFENDGDDLWQSDGSPADRLTRLGRLVLLHGRRKEELKPEPIPPVGKFGEPWRFDHRGRDYILNADGLPLADGWKARAVACVAAMIGIDDPAAFVANAHAQAAEIARLSKALEEYAKSAIEAEAAACDKTPAVKWRGPHGVVIEAGYCGSCGLLAPTAHLRDGYAWKCLSCRTKPATPAAAREELAKIVLKEFESHRGWSETKYDIVDALLARLRQPGPPFRLVDWPPPHFDADGMVRVNHQWRKRAVEAMVEAEQLLEKLDKAETTAKELRFNNRALTAPWARGKAAFAPLRTLDHDQYTVSPSHINSVRFCGIAWGLICAPEVSSWTEKCVTGMVVEAIITRQPDAANGPLVSYDLKDLGDGTATFRVIEQRSRGFKPIEASNGWVLKSANMPAVKCSEKIVYLRGSAWRSDNIASTFPAVHLPAVRLALAEFNEHMEGK